MLDIASFHSRLCDFAANVILDYSEMVRSAATTSSSVQEVKEPPLTEQGELFADFVPKTIEKTGKAVRKPRWEKETKPIAPKLDINRYHKPKMYYTYEEYLTIHCGNVAAADYWWHKNLKAQGTEDED